MVADSDWSLVARSSRNKLKAELEPLDLPARGYLGRAAAFRLINVRKGSKEGRSDRP